MEEIVFADAKHLQQITVKTVDRFSLLTRTLLASTKNHTEFMSTAMGVLKTVTKQTVHVNNLYGVLGEVTLTLATEQYFKNNITIAGDMKTQGRKPRVITFDDDIMRELKKMDQMTNLHTAMVRKLKDAQKVFWKLDSISENCREDITKHQYSNFLMELADNKSNNKELKRRQKAYGTSKAETDHAELFFYKLVEEESVMKNNLKLMNENLQNKIKEKIVQCLDSGLDDLRYVIQLFPQNTRTERCLNILESVNKSAVAEKLVEATSRIYYCPKVMGHEDLHGYASVKENIVMRTEKQTTGFKLQSGLIQATKTKVAVVDVMVSKVPAILTLKKGMKIKQKLEFGDLELGFGYRRQLPIPMKTWGLYCTELTRTC